MPTMDAQTSQRVDAEIAKLVAESVKLNNEARKLVAETGKLSRETFWYPIAIAAGLMGAGAALFGSLGKLFA